MKLVNYAILAMGLVAMPLSARQLTPAEALNAAKMSGINAVAGQMKSPGAYRLATTIERDGFNSCYIFNRADRGGFVVLAADDVVTPVLGYSDNGAFDPDNVPAAMREMLEDYQAQIEYAVRNPQVAERSRVRMESAPAESITPILTTLWNQGSPYNGMCPEFGGKRSVTGCVATAFAQVMKFHNWPKRGKGKNSYSVSYGGETVQVESDFSAHEYDWANMTNTYSSKSTDVEKAAVAQLMFDVGCASYMSYSPESSGAVSSKGAQAMIANFDYDKSMLIINRCDFYINDWVTTLYNELKANRPVYLSGRNTEAGHAFVCDGYSFNNYFHINWGWGGMSDGYYLLTLLDPVQQGIGGSSDGYTTNQTAIISIKPNAGTADYALSIGNQGGFKMQQQEFSRSMSVPFGIRNTTRFVQNTVGGGAGTLGVKLVGQDGSVSYLWSNSHFDDNANGYSFGQYSIYASNFPAEGTYTVTPAYKGDNGKIVDVAVDVCGPMAQILVATESRLSFTPQIPEGETKALSITPKAKFYIDQPFAFETVIMTTTPEYIGEVQPKLLNASGAVVAKGETIKFDIAKDEPTTTLWLTSMTGTNLTPGTYRLALLDNDARLNLGEIEVTVEANPGDPKFDKATFSTDPICISGRWSHSDPAIVDRNSAVKVKINVTQGQLVDEIYLGYGNASGYVLAESKGQFVSAQAGQTIELTFWSPFASIGNDELYGLMIKGKAKNTTYNEYGTVRRVWFKVTGEDSGVDDVVVDESDAAPAEYFNLQGIRISEPAKGQMVIRRQGSKVEKIIAR